MSAALVVLLLIAYLSICYQDFKVREVYLLTYFVMYSLLGIIHMKNPDFINTDYIIINSCILIIVSCLLLMYYLIRYGHELLLKIKASIGWGDVLMLPVFVISFSPANMILVFNLTLLLALLYHIIGNYRVSSIRTIPLAGIQSLVLSLIIIADYFGLIKMQTDFLPLF